MLAPNEILLSHRVQSYTCQSLWTSGAHLLRNLPKSIPATKPPTLRPRSQALPATRQIRASRSQSSSTGTPARPRLPTDKGYQHHGFSCFFFLRPIAASFWQIKREEKTSRKNEEINCSLFRPNGHHRVPQETDTKWPTPSFALRLPSGTAAEGGARDGRIT